MKKRIVALLLVLVLSMAMMVPVFAALVEPRACTHVWVDCGNEYIASYGEILGNDTHHLVNYYVPQICRLCAMQTNNPTVSLQGAHVYSNYRCTLCGHYHSNYWTK